MTRAWSATSPSRRQTTRRQAELDRANAEIALHNEELTIKADRVGRVPPRRHPHNRSTDRMRILQLMSARGWSTTEAYMGSPSEALSIEPRSLWLIREQTERATRVDLIIKFVEGRRHLPIVELKRAA